MKKIIFSVLLFISISGFSQKNFWKAISLNQSQTFTKGQALFPGLFKPAVYKLFSLDESGIQTFLKQTPLQNKVSIERSNNIIAIPAANGNIEHYRIVEAPVMQPKLQAKYPGIRTYKGQGIEHPSSVIRFDYSKHGFHAIIISPEQKTIYINPAATAKRLYVVFDRSNIAQEKQVFDCNVDKVLNSEVQGVAKPVSSDGKLRTYRFAVASGGEFSNRLLSGSETTDMEKKTKVLAALVSDLVRTNAIFETDFGIHLSYVDNEDTIIFLNGTTDPFKSGALAFYTGQWNTQSQQAIDKYIGNANYDVGHLLMGYATGGNAGCIGCVCNTANKGSGATGFNTDLTSDPFIVDFWDHEIGHQFGANHTFDYSFEGSGAQMEPGSGSTIMGYAGTTGSSDIQPHSDAYFHAASIEQINAYTTTGVGAACAVVTSTGDNVPVANAKKDYTIPKSTPFVLTGKGSDADLNDSLTYCWEQYDVFTNNGASNKFPNATSVAGPVFRSLEPTTSNQRYFPILSNILDGTNENKWEVLPSVTRQLNFRLTVRDNHPGSGSTNSDDMVVTVDSTSGPFLVTSHDSAITWNSGSRQKITWSVNNTNVAPVNCKMVSILLSTDGGLTFPIILADSIKNDGAAKITVPEISTTHARIKVAAVKNIFFDISNVDFTINQNSGIAHANINKETLQASTAKKLTVQPNPAKDYTTIVFNTAYKQCNVILTNAGGKQVYQKNLSQVNKGTTEKISLAGFTKGIYFLKVISSGNETETQTIIVE